MARKAAVAESLLSIADISRHFSLPESTTRYYCKRFAQFIPSVGDGRRRRYRRETLDVISAILEQMHKSRTAAAVEDALIARFPRNAVAVHEMRARGNWLFPTFNGEPRHHKPILAYWLMGLSTAVLGEGTAGMRLHSALAGTGRGFTLCLALKSLRLRAKASCGLGRSGHAEIEPCPKGRTRYCFLISK